MIVGRCPDDVAVGGDHLDLHEVVDGEPVLAHEPADAAAQGEAADAGVAHDAARGGQTVRLRLVVDVAPQGAALDVGRALDGIDRDGAHRREVDHDAVVAHRGAGHVVAPASYGDLEVTVAGEAHRRGHVGGAAAAGDQPRSSVDGAVPDGSGVVVLIMLRGDDVAPEPGNLDRGSRCHRSSSRSGLIATPEGPEEKSAIWTSKSGIWTSRRSSGGGHCDHEDLRPVLPDRPRCGDLR